MNRRLAALLVPALLAVAGCTATGQGSATTPTARAERPSPFADCATLTRPPATIGDATPGAAATGTATPGAAATATATLDAAAPAATGTGGAGPVLPGLILSCFTGGTPVALRDVRGPAVVNVWASWCPPCRKELPAFQRLSEQTAGRLQVIGVNSRDTRSAAQSIGEDYGIRFPMLFDQGEALQRELGRNALPLTILVDAQGRVRHTDATGALDHARLAALVRQHLGVQVSR
ncbi:Thiol-disulfide isomerase or thioredoxin [Micromonospora purpureochromogenes]|uniref:Thiol-disulfide isomerase or thioredoxin n=1 Tax=Micromonospora purpureochromogenes TaxID=47872 RepID=A0A1C4V5W7_9ACTN|nr:TlpA disulfide reductase family protein [Micromonospora purpureochromogenes]SCE79364.1 Thiol-disulfide isomerase or thioredoxin [Micromonospora purpureochromogenes]